MNQRNPIRRRRGELDAGARWPPTRVAGVLLSLLTLVCGLLIGAPTTLAAASDDAGFTVKPLCSAPAPGYSSCLGLALKADEPLAQPGTRAVAQSPSEAGAATQGDAAGEAAGEDAGEGQGLPPGEAAEHRTPSARSLTPEDILSAYGLTGAPAPGEQTIALIDAYNDPGAEADLQVFDEEFGLPECTGAAGNGCFEQVNQSGETTHLPFPTTAHELKAAREGNGAERKLAEQAAGWALEISTDIEVAHGVCPSCQILLVEADTNKNEDLYTAEQTAARSAQEISNSWGGVDEGVEYPQFNHPGVAITASAGDSGYLDWLKEPTEVAEYPASSPHVVAVGGTRLTLNPTTKAREGETVWNDGGGHETSHGVFRFEGHGATGGGCSLRFEAPPWQQELADWSSVGCEGRRAVADISADGDPYTGVAIYDSTEYESEKGWATIGGTSVASPIIGATFALAGGAHGVAYPAQTLYENERYDPASLNDIEFGSNGECLERPKATTYESSCTPEAEAQSSCSEQAICLAGPGYDGPSGVGTPNGLAAFSPLTEHGNERTVAPGGGGGDSSPPAPGSSEPGAVTSGGGDPAGAATTPTPVIGALKLTHTALAAIARRRAKLSQLGFSFKLSAATRVRVTLAERVRVRGRLRWRTISAPLSFLASRGAQSRHLSGRAALAPGRYLLTLTPTHGAAKSLQFRIA